MLARSTDWVCVMRGWGLALATVLVSFGVGTAGQPENAAAGKDSILILVNAESFTRLPSQWPEYFGTHYAGSPEGVGRWWNTVRSYGGTHTGVYATDRSESHVGPFTDRTVRVGLSDFHSRHNRSGRSAEQLIPDLIEHRLRPST